MNHRTDTGLRPEPFMEQALHRWGDTVFRLALAQTRSAADAQDVVQDVFLRLLTDGTAFTSDEHLKAWLLRATINRCRDLHRSAWRQRVDAFGDEDGLGAERIEATDPSPEERALRSLARNPVWDALKRLPEDQRIVMHLRYVEECTDTQIAQALDVKPATVRTRLHRARNALRRILEAAETAETPRSQEGESEPVRGAHAPRAPDEPGHTPAPVPASAPALGAHFADSHTAS